LYDISERVGPFPSSPEGPVAQGRDVQHRFLKQWRLKPLFLVELTLASVLRESFKSIAWLLLVKRHILLRKRFREKIHRLRRKPAPRFQFASSVLHGLGASEGASERRDVQQQEAARQFAY
jgi:hypothetical protein